MPTLSDGLTGDVTGYNVYVGGGLGMSHAREDDTYPLLAEPLGWVTPERVVDVVEAVVTTQRDYGNREDRHRARLKYLVETRGIEWIRAEVGAPGRVPAGRRRRSCRRGRPRSTTAPATASSACRCRPARSPTVTASTCARRCAS